MVGLEKDNFKGLKGQLYALQKISFKVLKVMLAKCKVIGMKN